jgi:hypothetical protein
MSVLKVRSTSRVCSISIERGASRGAALHDLGAALHDDHRACPGSGLEAVSAARCQHVRARHRASRCTDRQRRPAGTRPDAREPRRPVASANKRDIRDCGRHRWWLPPRTTTPVARSRCGRPSPKGRPVVAVYLTDFVDCGALRRFSDDGRVRSSSRCAGRTRVRPSGVSAGRSRWQSCPSQRPIAPARGRSG